MYMGIVQGMEATFHMHILAYANMQIILTKTNICTDLQCS
jgi:hypothetical protein